jgi:cytidylate kinase
MIHTSSSQRMAEAMERARRHWRASREVVAVGTSAKPAPPPWTIALSREAGTGGPAVARAVGERLNWPVYDHELVERIAAEMGLRTSLLESVDERHGSWLRECLGTFFGAAAAEPSAYVRHLKETLLSLAAHGGCVIVGRGAAQFLPWQTTLRVRLVAPPEQRIAAARQRRGCTQQEAARWVEATDRERTRFVQDHFGKDPHEVRQYDLVLNAGRFAVAECAELTVNAWQCLQRGVGVPGCSRRAGG